MNTQVIPGGTGALGSAVMRHLVVEKVPVRAFVLSLRHGHTVLPESVELIQSDVTDSGSMPKACEGAAVVYHCVSVPHSKWVDLMPTIAANILTGAKKTGTRLAFPSNVYGYGHFQQIPPKEDDPKVTTTKKDQLRSQVEETVWATYGTGDA